MIAKGGISSAALAAVLLIASGSLGTAQVSGRGERLQDGQDRLIRMFLDQATVELNLSADQRAGLEGVMQETLERRAELRREQLQLRRRIREALANPQTAGEEFRQLADAVTAAKRQELELSAWQQGRLLEVLTPRQTLRFMLLQEQLARRIEDLRRRRADRRR